MRKAGTHCYDAHVGNKNTVTLEIAGTKVRMTSDADEAFLNQLASSINERVAGFGPKAARTASPAQLLAMVAMDLAADLVTAEHRLEDLEELTRRTVEDAISRIDQRLGQTSSDRA